MKGKRFQVARELATEEIVWSIAQQMHDAGQEPSIVRIHARIGGGSFTTVKRHLDAWKAQRLVTSSLPPVPDMLQQKMDELVKNIWHIAITCATEEVAYARAEAEKHVAQARAETAEAEHAINILENQVDDLDSAVAQMQQERDDARSALVQAQAATGIAEARLADMQRQLEAHIAELTHTRSEARARLVGEVEALRRHLDAAPTRPSGA
ncbi:MAG: DNA-binding protein [Candidatus Viridilinea halotolerans]|uniref:DNA-binding protein n=1 Tax=Candidatus Viridilinea halotolerans TaxID=2491704 RepID=A0A426UCI7_9CHLR|nr:MAG: DNA-binding protein [Candidatus Viridilinea halotolerans]